MEEKKSNSSNNRKRLILVSRLLFAVYMAFVVFFMFFSDREVYTEYRYNTTLFAEVKRFWHNIRIVGIKALFLNFFGNMIAFIPFGMFLPMVNKKMKHMGLVVFLSFLFSLCIESIQLYFKVGVFDVDDLLLNTVGGFIGYMIYLLIRKGKYILYRRG